MFSNYNSVFILSAMSIFAYLRKIIFKTIYKYKVIRKFIYNNIIKITVNKLTKFINIVSICNKLCVIVNLLLDF